MKTSHYHYDEREPLPVRLADSMPVDVNRHWTEFNRKMDLFFEKRGLKRRTMPEVMNAMFKVARAEKRLRAA